MKTILVVAVAALFSACSSPPKLQFPTGENRTPINGPRTTAAVKPPVTAAADTPQTPE